MSLRKLNFWKLATFLLLAVLGLIFSLGFTQSRPANRTVEAEEFVLKDSGGKVRGWIGIKGDQPTIQLYDEDRTTIWNSAVNRFDPGIVKPKPR